MKKAPLTSQGSIRDARSRRKKGSGEVVDLSILHEGELSKHSDCKIEMCV